MTPCSSGQALQQSDTLFTLVTVGNIPSTRQCSPSRANRRSTGSWGGSDVLRIQAVQEGQHDALMPSHAFLARTRDRDLSTRG